tara:strand:+ start:59 stop:499 length:441 start_codon:yes stop_codon:yes gene_type:complete
MKKLIFSLAALNCLVAFGQIGKATERQKFVDIGVANKMVGYPKLSKAEGTDSYCIYYRNLEYKQLEDFKTFCFNASESELDYLYDALMQPILEKDKSKKSITVGEVTLNFSKVSSSISVYVDNPIGETDAWMGYFTKKQLTRLFGK